MATYYHAERFTNCDIEVYVGNVLEGLTDTIGIDQEASQQKAEDLVEEAILQAYPQYTVHVGTARGGEAWFAIASYPNDLDPAFLVDIADDTLTASSAWVVEEGEDE